MHELAACQAASADCYLASLYRVSLDDLVIAWDKWLRRFFKW